MQNEPNTKNNKTQKKLAKKMNQARLENIAMYYLERFGGTEKTLRDTLKRRIAKSLKDHPDQDIDTINEWVDAVVEKSKRYNYINDETFAKLKVKQLLSKGNSKKMIIAKLKQKGITDTILRNIFEETDDNSELLSAVAYAKKRKFGCYNVDFDGEINEKHLASMARRGFSYDISKQALLNKF